MRKNNLFLLLFILVGSIIGGVIGELLGKLHPIFSYGKSIGFAPFTIDLAILQLTIGFTMSLTIAGIIGLLIGMWLFYRIK